jgi:all-trans-8'-apo-beta-carotenal 15,15'-oxygenase
MAPSAPAQAQPTTAMWAAAIAQPASEFAATPLTLLEGRLPADLRGTLYRNGPARFERGGHPSGPLVRRRRGRAAGAV